MSNVDKSCDTFLYRQVIDLIRENIDSGTLRPGDRLPSLRKMSQTAGVSIPTVRQAYVELESQRRVEARPKSGYYVRHRRAHDIVLPGRTTTGTPGELEVRPLMERVYDGINRPELVPLGIANPTMAKPAAKTLHRTMKRVMARAEERSLGYAVTTGEPTLRRQIAYHYLDTLGVKVQPDEICITNGGQEALLLALRAVAKPGDVIAVETPTYHGMLELIDSLGMLAIEVETCPEEGVVVRDLERIIAEHPVKACIFSTTLNNPLGVTMPLRDRRRLAALLEEHDIALVEDDVYGDLRFDGERPMPVAFLNDNIRVLTCGSFSKTAAPGYRIGWIYTRDHIDDVRHLKRSFSCASGLLPQLTLAEFMASGDYARHLTALRSVLQYNAERMAAVIEEAFPADTRTSRPVGGSVMWLELSKDVNSEQLMDEAIEAGISIAPGDIFSPCGCYTNFIRLSFGHPWCEETEEAIRWLGQRVGGNQSSSNPAIVTH